MNVRQTLEARQREWLAPAAARADLATRPQAEDESDVRTAYQRDRDRILHSKAFRRLKHKTQVFLSPSGDHVRTRMTHTLEVTQIARTIARALDLNEDLTEAIGLGHDLGHTPFGHTGERALARMFPGFRHNEQSLRVVDRLEKDGAGLNLTNDTRDGILRHSKPEAGIAGEMAGTPATAEAQIVKISDGIAYINHDFDDAVRAGLIDAHDLPEFVGQTLGTSHSQRIDTLVHDVIVNSRPFLASPADGRQVIQMSDGILAAADEMRTFLFERVYHPVNRRAATKQAEQMIEALFEYYVANADEAPEVFAPSLVGESVERRVADIISGMTDRYAVNTYTTLFLPSPEEH
ncbi:MAG: deoxyguanosinetriphosphate triphosphohydrolase [Thermomicrobiales bacterium]|nr:deoxyguanosinetriphosphate triphosphohydrolase [Thermomicrobiales bacterium]